MENSKKSSYGFYEKLDPDLPNFTSTKRKSVAWKCWYAIAFFGFAVCYFGGAIRRGMNDSEVTGILYACGSLFYVGCASMKWWHYHRGCCSYSNLNSVTKTNVDNSCKAKFNRAKFGILHFCSLVMSIVLLLNFSAKVYMKFTVDEALYECIENVSDVVFVGAMIALSMLQVCKLEKIANPTKQYNMLNDISNFFVEWFLLFGLFIYSLGLVGNVLQSDNNIFLKRNIHQIFLIVGGMFLIISSFFACYRFFCSDDSDLNISFSSDLSD